MTRNVIFIDLEAVEARVLAFYKKPVVDLHTQRASDYYEIPPSEVTREQRAVAKLVYYMEIYKASPEEVECLWETNR